MWNKPRERTAGWCLRGSGPICREFFRWSRLFFLFYVAETRAPDEVRRVQNHRAHVVHPHFDGPDQVLVQADLPGRRRPPVQGADVHPSPLGPQKVGISTLTPFWKKKLALIKNTSDGHYSPGKTSFGFRINFDYFPLPRGGLLVSHTTPDPLWIFLS